MLLSHPHSCMHGDAAATLVLLIFSSKGIPSHPMCTGVAVEVIGMAGAFAVQWAGTWPHEAERKSSTYGGGKGSREGEGGGKGRGEGEGGEGEGRKESDALEGDEAALGEVAHHPQRQVQLRARHHIVLVRPRVQRPPQPCIANASRVFVQSPASVSSRAIATGLRTGV